jgi:hypothetical protein
MFKQLSALSLFAAALAAPLARRGDVSAVPLVGFPQEVLSGIEGTLMLKYQPYLQVVDGCVPFPAVDAAGDTRSACPNTIPYKSVP